MEKLTRPPFENKMTQTQQLLGALYLALHAVIFPLLFRAYLQVAPDPVTSAIANLVLYAVGAVFVLAVMFRYLRGQFDVLLDRLPYCILTGLLAIAVLYALDTAALLLLTLLQPALSNPATEQTMEMAQRDFGTIRAIAVFLAPVVEEVLFRGVLFGAVRGRSRGWAYVVSAAAFSLYHVWQYAVFGRDWSMLLYAVQYIPISAVLAWCYERSGSLWTSIFFHMGFNAVNFAVLSML